MCQHVARLPLLPHRKQVKRCSGATCACSQLAILACNHVRRLPAVLSTPPCVCCSAMLHCAATRPAQAVWRSEEDGSGARKTFNLHCRRCARAARPRPRRMPDVSQPAWASGAAAARLSALPARGTILSQARKRHAARPGYGMGPPACSARAQLPCPASVHTGLHIASKHLLRLFLEGIVHTFTPGRVPCSKSRSSFATL